MKDEMNVSTLHANTRLRKFCYALLVPEIHTFYVKCTSFNFHETWHEGRHSSNYANISDAQTFEVGAARPLYDPEFLIYLFRIKLRCEVADWIRVTLDGVPS